MSKNNHAEIHFEALLSKTEKQMRLRKIISTV